MVDRERADNMGRVCTPKRSAVERIPAWTSSSLSWRKILMHIRKYKMGKWLRKEPDEHRYYRIRASSKLRLRIEEHRLASWPRLQPRTNLRVLPSWKQDLIDDEDKFRSKPAHSLPTEDGLWPMSYPLHERIYCYDWQRRSSQQNTVRSINNRILCVWGYIPIPIQL